jgi:hypothetical protein
MTKRITALAPRRRGDDCNSNSREWRRSQKANAATLHIMSARQKIKQMPKLSRK